MEARLEQGRGFAREVERGLERARRPRLGLARRLVLRPRLVRRRRVRRVEEARR